MLFNSIHFVFFFPLVVAVYFALPFRFRWAFLLAASYYFYASWKASYLILIIVSTLIDYFAALLMGATKDKRKRRRYLYLSLLSNLGLLFTFKYLDFFTQNFEFIFSFYGLPLPHLDVLLPVGISFYTFQTLSYTIDVYRGEREPERHLGYFALYVSFFPQLVAGPIERSTSLMPQFFKKHEIDTERIRSGLLLMMAGFFKKLVVADRLAVYVGEIYDNPGTYHGFPVVIATYFFAFQIFCDFSGYSDIAIGAARVMGYDLMENFRTPYCARGISEFWHRWHISLSTWMRDYVYIPLGGNRASKRRWLANLMITFVVSGLWHGAQWTFVIWGFLHGMYLIVGVLTKEARARFRSAIGLSRLPGLESAIQVAITFHLVLFAWVFFASDSVGDAFTILGTMFQGLSISDPRIFAPLNGIELTIAIAALLAMETAHLIQRRGGLQSRLVGLPLPVRWAVYYIVFFGIVAFGQFTSTEFIYFQF